MTENTSWLKKSAAGPSLRTLHFNMPDINSTMTMQNGDGETMTKFPKRKSCMAFKQRTLIPQAPSVKKTKPVSSESNPAGFRNRTLKMVQARESMMPKAVAARRSQIASRRPMQKMQSTPIQSTPFDAPRSILRRPRFQETRPPSAKKVIFDAATVEEGVFPLQESTIQDFTNYDLRKTVTKVDASTNTEPITENEPIQANDAMLALWKEMSGKLDQLLERKNCYCTTPLPRGNPVKTTYAEFMDHLDNIQEVSENVTPNTVEASNNPTPTVLSKDSDTPKLKAVDCKPLVAIRDTDLVEEKTENNADTHSELIVGSTTECIESAKMSPDIEENVRRSARLQGTNHEDSPQPAISRLRKFRKRAIPRHLESFELSPRVKRSTGNKRSN